MRSPISAPGRASPFALLDRKSLLALWGVGPESEAEACVSMGAE